MCSKHSWNSTGIVRLCEGKEAITVLWSHHEESRELPGEKDCARNNAHYTQNRKTTYGLHKHQHVGQTCRSIRMTNDRDPWRKYVHPLCSQPSDQRRLMNSFRRNENIHSQRTLSSMSNDEVLSAQNCGQIFQVLEVKSSLAF